MMSPVQLSLRQLVRPTTLTFVLIATLLTIALTPATTAQRSIVFVHGIFSTSQDFDIMEPWIKKV